MADLTAEQYQQLPEFIRGDYAQEGDVFKPVGELKAAKLKNSLNELDNKFKETSGKLSEYEKRQAELSAEAERKALERLKSEGKVDEIVADAERRINETRQQYENELGALKGTIKTEKRSNIVAALAAEMATEKGRKVFQQVVAARIDVDPMTGKVTVLNEDGSASSLDLAGLKSELESNPDLEPLLKSSVVTYGGGNANGSQGGSASFGAGKFGGSRDERRQAIKAKFKLNE
jgi:uncharacterized protein YjbJ (UPF0337 family)